jgi:hypothetical protein
VTYQDASSASANGTPVIEREQIRLGTENFFIAFVDRMFTSLIEPLFTNVFDVVAASAAIACLYRACNAD